MRLSPRSLRLARGVAAGAIGLAFPMDKIVLAVMLGVQLRNIWILETQHEEEVRARGGGDSGDSGDSVGRLHTQASVIPSLWSALRARYGSRS